MGQATKHFNVRKFAGDTDPLPAEWPMNRMHLLPCDLSAHISAPVVPSMQKLVIQSFGA
jgi:hypothetical protein